jgi:hypothetical protein
MQSTLLTFFYWKIIAVGVQNPSDFNMHLANTTGFTNKGTHNQIHLTGKIFDSKNSMW